MDSRSTSSDVRLIVEDMEGQSLDDIPEAILYPKVPRKDEDDIVVCINLRGTKFTVHAKHFSRYPDSILNRKYQELTKITGSRRNEIQDKPLEMFFDHNPALFHHIWDAFVVNDAESSKHEFHPGSGRSSSRGRSQPGKMHVPRTFCTRYVEEELAFWGLAENEVLHPCCWDKLVEGQENADTLMAVVREWRDEDALRNKHGEMTRRERMHLFLEEPRTSKFAMAYTSFIMLITIGSIVTWLLESLPTCRFIIPGKQEVVRNATKHRLDTFLRYSLPEPYLWYADIIAALVLLTDYILRFIASPVRWRFLVNPLNLADVTGLIPILVMVGMDFYQLSYAVDDTFLHAMYVLNITRVLRVLRMFRVIQHYKPLKVVYWAWKASYRELLLLLIIISVSACVFGSLIYYIELYEDNILTIPHGMWWAIVTMTTVGYGDVVPLTPAGSFMGCLCAITGLLVIAMPIPVIVQNFGRYYEAVQMTSRLTKHQSEDVVKGGEDMRDGEDMMGREDMKSGDVMKTNTTTSTSAYNNRSSSAMSLKNKVAPHDGRPQ